MKFSRQFRLLKPEQFQRVFKQAIGSGDRCFRVLARANSLPHHRLGMAVSKKKCPLAVGRNRIKRVVRESFRKHLAEQLPPCALDIIVLPTALASTHKNADLEYSLALHWQKLSTKMMTQKPGRDSGQNVRTRPIKDRGQ